MLVLQRRVGEWIFFELPGGGMIRLQLMEIRHPYHLRVGIDAPKDVAIYREEVYRRMQKESGDAQHTPGE